jgi:hypothetical protein
MAKHWSSCDFCRIGRVSWRKEVMTFRQWSDKGYVHCRVRLPVGTCAHCQAKSLDADSDQMFDAAFQRAYDRLK